MGVGSLLARGPYRCRRGARLRERFRELRQHQRGVAHHPLIARKRPADVLGLDVDLDEGLAAGVEQRGILVGGIGGTEAGAHRQHQIGRPYHTVRGLLTEVPEYAEGLWVGLRKYPLARGGSRHRSTEQFRQARQLGKRLADPHPVAGDDYRLLGLRQQRRGGVDLRRIGGRLGRQVGGGGIQRGATVGPTVPRSAALWKITPTGPRSPVSACLIASWVTCTASTGV